MINSNPFCLSLSSEKKIFSLISFTSWQNQERKRNRWRHETKPKKGKERKREKQGLTYSTKRSLSFPCNKRGPFKNCRLSRERIFLLFLNIDRIVIHSLYTGMKVINLSRIRISFIWGQKVKLELFISATLIRICHGCLKFLSS